MKTHRYGCPHCGSERVNVINTLRASYRVRSWDEDGAPTEYSEVEPHWDTAKRIEGEPFECEHCWSTFAEPKRIEEVPGEGWRLRREVRRIRLPEQFYEPRRTLGGGTVRGGMPYEGAVAYVTDSLRYGIQYDNGHIDWLGTDPVSAFGEGAEVVEVECERWCDDAQERGDARLAVGAGPAAPSAGESGQSVLIGGTQK